MRKKHLFLFVLFMQALLFRSHAAKITVTSNADNVGGSLRYAIDNAGSGDTILFDWPLIGPKISISPNIIVIDKDLTIIGPGEDKLNITNNETVALIKIEPGVNVYISGITISECSSYRVLFEDGVSEAIYNQGNLTVEDTYFVINYSGAIYNAGNLSLNKVKFRGNYTLAHNSPGKAACITNVGNASVRNCIMDGNFSDAYSESPNPIIRNTGTLVIESTSITRNECNGQDYSVETGVIHNSGTMNVINSTIGANLIVVRGVNCTSGFYNTGQLKLEYCTVAYNFTIDYDHNFEETNKASGVLNRGHLYLKGTIIAQNGLPENYTAVKGQSSYELEKLDGISYTTIHDLGNNLIGINDGLNLKPLSNILGTRTKFCDPGLWHLQNYGGYSDSYALKEGSRCIDAGGSSNTVLVDQRGYARNKPDIGAIEYYNIPQISLLNLDENIQYIEPLNIDVEAKVTTQKTHLLVTHVPGYKKLKLGYDNIGLYHSNENVIAGGNDTLEITLKSYYEGTDWNKIEIRPNGSDANPLSLSNYAGHLNAAMSEYQTIKSPFRISIQV